MARFIEQHARVENLDPALVKALIAVESSFQPDAVSPTGALGLMQVIPETAARYGVVGDKKRSAHQKLLDPAINLRIGTRYLHDLLGLFENNLALALAAYNAGEQAVQSYNKRIPPFPETQEYVKLVQQLYALYRPARPASGRIVGVFLPRKLPVYRSENRADAALDALVSERPQ